MKYIKLFESFESDTVSNIIKYLKKEKMVSNSEIGKGFIDDLKDIGKRYDLLINKLNNDIIKYMKSDKALAIKASNKVNNQWEVESLKFWFSLNRGYLGYTGIGNKEIDYDNFIKERTGFSASQMNVIRNNFGYNNGILTFIDDKKIYKLKTGDEVVAIICHSLEKGTIFISRGKYYMIQDNFSGSEPSNVESSEWKIYGRYSWCIGNSHSLEDVSKLHLYEENRNEEESEKKPDNNLSYNLPVYYDGKLTNWENGGSIQNVNSLKEADYAVIINIDKMLSKNITKPSEIINKRTETKSGATKFMTDNELKDINVNRYLNQIIINMGFSKESHELKNLEKIILRTLISKDTAFMAIYSGNAQDGLSSILKYVKGFIEAIKNSNELGKKEYSEYIIRMIKNETKNVSIYKEKYQKIIEYVESSNDSNLKLMFDNFKQISQKIYQAIKEDKINTYGELRIIYQKIVSIKSYCRGDESFSRYIQHCMNNLNYGVSDFKSILITYNEKATKDDVELSNDFVKVVNSFFK